MPGSNTFVGLQLGCVKRARTDLDGNTGSRERDPGQMRGGEESKPSAWPG